MSSTTAVWGKNVFAVKLFSRYNLVHSCSKRFKWLLCRVAHIIHCGSMLKVSYGWRVFFRGLGKSVFSIQNPSEGSRVSQKCETKLWHELTVGRYMIQFLFLDGKAVHEYVLRRRLFQRVLTKSARTILRTTKSTGSDAGPRSPAVRLKQRLNNIP